MSKLKNIINGYKNLIIRDETMHPLYLSRLEICKTCPNNISGICKLCGCIIAAKARSPEEDCPGNYWKPILREDTETGDLFINKNELPENLQIYFKDDTIDYADWKEFLSYTDKSEY